VRSMHVSCVAVRGRDGDCRRTAAHTQVMQHARPTRHGVDRPGHARAPMDGHTRGGTATDCSTTEGDGWVGATSASCANPRVLYRVTAGGFGTQIPTRICNAYYVSIHMRDIRALSDLLLCDIARRCGGEALLVAAPLPVAARPVGGALVCPSLAIVACGPAGHTAPGVLLVCATTTAKRSSLARRPCGRRSWGLARHGSLRGRHHRVHHRDALRVCEVDRLAPPVGRALALDIADGARGDAAATGNQGKLAAAAAVRHILTLRRWRWWGRRWRRWGRWFRRAGRRVRWRRWWRCARRWKGWREGRREWWIRDDEFFAVDV